MVHRLHPLPPGPPGALCRRRVAGVRACVRVSVCQLVCHFIYWGVGNLKLKGPVNPKLFFPLKVVIFADDRQHNNLCHFITY